jgi:NADPH2:quinone reductase
VFPAVLGLDLAGVFEEIGNKVTEFRVGDEVYAMGRGIGGLQGSLATHIAADVDLLALKPQNLSMREAAAMPLTVITAWEGLVDRARVHEGNKVLVHAGAGGVGHVAVQIALALGARVFATVSEDKMRIVESYGATAINYKEQQVESYVAEHTGSEGFDIVYDTVAELPLTIASTQSRSIPGTWSVVWAGEHTSLPHSSFEARRTRVCSPCFPCCRVTTGGTMETFFARQLLSPKQAN